MNHADVFMKRFLHVCVCIGCLFLACCQNASGQEIIRCMPLLETGSAQTVQRQQEWTEAAGQFSDFHRDELNLYARSAVLTDAETGRILYGKDANTPMANASTTKIMTCLLAIESGKSDDVVTFSENASSMPNVRLGCPAGTQFKLEDLLYSLMLESHNDTAVAIAEDVAGSVENFAEQMNKRAVELGCQNTHFVTANGLDASDAGGAHQTTAYDLSLIMAACIKNEKFLEITETTTKTISSMDGTCQVTLNNHNALLSMMNGVIAGKTGFTAKAGYCYVGAYRQEDRVCAFALLACGWPSHKGYKWEDSKKLITYGNETYHRQAQILQADVLKLPIHNGVQITGSDGARYRYPEYLTVKTKTVRQDVLLSDADVVTEEWNLPDNLEAPLQKGKYIGEKRIFLNGCQILTQPVYAAETVEKFDYRWCLKLLFLYGI